MIWYDARVHRRGPVTVRTYLRSLRSLWNTHFKQLGYVRDNPWLAVPYPAVPKTVVRVPTEPRVTEFFTWLDERYPQWELVGLFVRVKMLAGCRTLDLCGLRADQLTGDGLVFTPSDTKTHQPRTVPLPADIAVALRRLRGRVYL